MRTECSLRMCSLRKACVRYTKVHKGHLKGIASRFAKIFRVSGWLLKDADDVSREIEKIRFELKSSSNPFSLASGINLSRVSFVILSVNKRKKPCVSKTDHHG